MTLEELISCCDSKLLLYFFSKSDLLLHREQSVPENLCQKILDAQKRNSKGEPLAYILGERAFYRNVFKVTKGVLIPQPDSETLVDEAISFLKTCNKKEVSVLDLCAGSGCLGISVAKEVSPLFEKINLFLSDICPVAFKCFSSNASSLINEKNIKVNLLQGDLFSTVENEKFDIIISNPPYIASGVIPTLSEEVKHEPLLALDGGKDGLDFYNLIAEDAPAHLKPGAPLVVEIGFDQGNSVRKIFESNSFSDISITKDLSGNDRVVKGFIK